MSRTIERFAKARRAQLAKAQIIVIRARERDGSLGEVLGVVGGTKSLAKPCSRS